MNRQATVLLLLALALLPRPAGAAGGVGQEPAKVPVYVSGKNGYHTYRIPALVVTTEGTVLAFCEGRKTRRSDHGDIDLMLRRSTDGGKTWSEQQIVHEEGATARITIGNPCPVVDKTTGTIWLGFCRNNDRVFMTPSDDDGRTWAKPVEITKDVKGPDWSWYATGPGHGIQIERGKHKGRLVIPCDHRVRDHAGGWKGAGRSHIVYSDDRGETWKAGTPTEWGMNECEAVERADGSLLLCMRNYLGKNQRAFATSVDGGQTWSKSQHHVQVYCPTCQASIHRHSLEPTNVILYSGPGSRGRNNLSIRASYDEGKTWPVAKVLQPGPSAYSDLAVLPDGTICCLYETGKKHPYETITFARLPLAWLTGAR